MTDFHVCGPHNNPIMEWEDESARRHKRGEVQRECGGCSKWYWPKWDKDVALHANCPAPKCKACGSRSVIDITKEISRRTHVVIGMRCLDCKHSDTFVKQLRAVK